MAQKQEELGQKSCRTKLSRIFRMFVPSFAPNFAPNFLRIFRGLFVLRFVGDGDQKNFTKNPRHFSMQNSQANTKKKIHKILLESRQSKEEDEGLHSLLRWHVFTTILSRSSKPHRGLPSTIRHENITLVIFFSLTEAPLPDPTPTPPNTPKRTRNGPKTDPKRSQSEPNGAETEPNGAEMDRNQAFRGGTGGGFVGVGWWGGCKGKRISLHYLPEKKKDFRIIFRLPFHDFDFFTEVCQVPLRATKT